MSVARYQKLFRFWHRPGEARNFPARIIVRCPRRLPACGRSHPVGAGQERAEGFPRERKPAKTKRWTLLQKFHWSKFSETGRPPPKTGWELTHRRSRHWKNFR